MTVTVADGSGTVTVAVAVVAVVAMAVVERIPTRCVWLVRARQYSFVP